MQSESNKVNNDVKTKIARLSNLPSLPALLMDALQHTADNQSLADLADKIGKDPPIVARILRIVNSPFYGMSREIGSLREAIGLLGVIRVRDMLVSSCFLSSFQLIDNGFNYPAFWHHSLAVADCARQLSLHTGINQDIAFTAGLLHDIGLLVIVLLFPEAYALIKNLPEPISIETEQQLMGFDHVYIGVNVAKHWNLPLGIQSAIEQHETPPTQNTASLGILIYTANLLINNSEQNNTNDMTYQDAMHHALGILDISIEQAIEWADSSQQFASQILGVL